ncbi:hypothetical protein [Qipengyuania flava]|uniref:hypothetical protein n=1 Tax=Qipengyuania flava TaxID=192812 RepID=UPI001C628F17|nr:hypothetical protein [Qipengyuania flava]QYJ07952.1 hypothetical protein KUV82_04385 [Qipengyuania flava]
MNNAIARRQGQPILFLGLLATGWLLLRIVTWESPLAPAPLLAEPLRFAGTGMEVEAAPITPEEKPAADDPPPAPLLPAPWGPVPAPVSQNPVAPPLAAPLPVSPPREDVFDPHRRGVGHAMLFAAGMASLPLPASVARIIDEEAESRVSAEASVPAQPTKRWRFDSWVVLRQGGAGLSGTGSQPASYGASQMGSVLAYRLAPSSRRQPSAYARASQALVAAGEREVALGLSARPLPRLPVSLHLEARVTERPGETEVRPAAFLAGGFERVDLPAGLRARGYGQAGYVHGDFATAFADGKIVADREVASFDLGKASLGVGAWGGAQKGAHRLDIGPTLSLDIRLGETPARLEADYRWRLAGNAEPGNGGVLTLSTGF